MVLLHIVSVYTLLLRVGSQVKGRREGEPASKGRPELLGSSEEGMRVEGRCAGFRWQGQFILCC